MKVCLVTNLYGEYARGGAERVVEQEAESLAAAGHDVVVVSAERKKEVPKGVCLPGEPWLCLSPEASAKGGPPPGPPEEVAAAYAAAVRRAATPGRPRVVRYHPPNIYFYSDDHRHGFASRFLWHLLDIFNAKSARTIGRILELERPDVVHTHNLMGLGFMVPAAVRRLGLRHVHTVHDVQLLHPSGLLPPGGKLPFFRRAPRAVYVALMRSMLGSPDAVVFPSRFLMEMHDARGFFPGSRRVVVRNPAPPAKGRRAAPAKKIFLFAGQLERHKGIMLLLDAWEKGAPEGAELEIAGVGSLEAEVRARAERLAGARMLGKLDRGGVMAACGRASFVVVPSLVIENAPTVIMEAMSSGTPVIAAAAGGIPELVREGENGYLFPPGDADALAAAIGRAAKDGGWSERSGAALGAAAANAPDAHLRALLGLYVK